MCRVKSNLNLSEISEINTEKGMNNGKQKEIEAGINRSVATNLRT
jgi:hypothetical protein